MRDKTSSGAAGQSEIMPRPGYCPTCGPVDLLPGNRCSTCKLHAVAIDTPFATNLEVVAFVPRAAMTAEDHHPRARRQHPPCPDCGAKDKRRYYSGSGLCAACYMRQWKSTAQ